MSASSNNPVDDPRLALLAALVAETFDAPASEGVDPVEHALALLTSAAAERRLPTYARSTIDEATDALFSISAHEFSARLPTEGSGDPLDGLAVAVNVLAAELARTAVSSQRMAGLLDSLPNPVLLVSLDRRVESANPAARAMLGEAIVDRPIHEVLSADEGIWPQAATPVRLTAELDDVHLLFSVAPLRSHFDDIEAFVAVGTNITEQIATQQALIRARDMAEANAQARSRFLANMSHEIRTPLNAVIGNAELLLEHALSGDQQQLVDQIRRSGTHLDELIGDVLDFSLVDNDKLELNLAPFEPRTVVKDAMALLKAKPTVELAAELDVMPRWMIGDALRLRQVLVNLLGNALKFTPRGRVLLRGRVEPGRAQRMLLHFEVEDTGIGIAEADLERLFDPFTQLDPTSTRAQGGTGLGLAIVNRLVTAMGGQISVESTLGAGSRFTFWVVVERSADPTNPPWLPPVEPDLLGPDLPGEERARSIGGQASPDMQGMRVLLVEDNPINQQLAARLVSRRGGDVVLATNGVEAIQEVEEAEFDLILMDCQMPVMDGLEATRRIRRMTNGVTVPIVALTADVVAGQRERCIDAGMDEYVRKPLRKAEFDDVLRRILPL